MMNWNKNDSKYIIKRLILYALISCIVFFGAQSCAKANVYTHQWKQYNNFTECPSGSNTCNIYANANGIYNGLGHGYITFTLVEWGEPQWYPIEQITITTTNASNVQLDYLCEIGNQNTYYDNGKQQALITAKCRVFLESSGLQYVTVQRPTSAVGKMYVAVGSMIQFETLESEANSIVNGIGNDIQQQIAAGNTNTQNLQNTIDNATAREIAAINASTQATNNNTDAINALTDFQKQDYTYNSELDDMFDFETLFQTDDDFLRRMILFPFTIFSLILNAINSNACVQYDFGELLGTHVIFPCINWKNYVGNGLYMVIDSVFAICITFGFIRYLIGLYDFIFSVGLKGGAVALSATVEAFK